MAIGQASFEGALDRAIADFTQSIELDSKFSEAYLNRGNAWSEKGNTERAISDYTKALEIDSDFVEAHFNRGLALYISSQYDQAISDFSEAVKLKPDFAEAYHYRAMGWGKKWGSSGGSPSHLMRALADAKKALEIRPENEEYQNLIHQLETELR